MTPEEITEGNILISVFMGEDIDDYGYKIFGPDDYGLDWNKLMHVVEKIESLGYISVIHGYGESILPESETYCVFKEGNYRRGYGEAKSKIEAVWLAVVGFIKWKKEND